MEAYSDDSRIKAEKKGAMKTERFKMSSGSRFDSWPRPREGVSPPKCDSWGGCAAYRAKQIASRSKGNILLGNFYWGAFTVKLLSARLA